MSDKIQPKADTATQDQPEDDHFKLSYYYEGAMRSASVTSRQLEGRYYFQCRLYDGSQVVVEDYIDDHSNSGWRFISGESSPLSDLLGEGIDDYYENK